MTAKRKKASDNYQISSTDPGKKRKQKRAVSHKVGNPKLHMTLKWVGLCECCLHRQGTRRIVGMVMCSECWEIHNHKSCVE